MDGWIELLQDLDMPTEQGALKAGESVGGLAEVGAPKEDVTLPTVEVVPIDRGDVEAAYVILLLKGRSEGILEKPSTIGVAEDIIRRRALTDREHRAFVRVGLKRLRESLVTGGTRPRASRKLKVKKAV